MKNKKKIILTLLFAIGFYILYSVAGNVSTIKETIVQISVGSYLYLLSLILIGYLFRFLRWHYLLKTQEIHLPYKQSLLIFITGMSMAISPGKLGEFLKTYYLSRDVGIEYTYSSPIILTERMTDLLAITILMSCGLFLIPNGIIVFSLSILIMLVMIYLLRKETFITGVIRLAEGKKRKR